MGLGNGDKTLIEFEELGGIDTLEHLQCHRNVGVYKEALWTLERYFYP
jgi:hypothetical protein